VPVKPRIQAEEKTQMVIYNPNLGRPITPRIYIDEQTPSTSKPEQR